MNKKKFGNGLLSSISQYLFKNFLLVDSIFNKSEINITDIVLEIGSGTGNLTIELLKKAKRVVSIEFDLKMILELYRRLRNSPNVVKLTQIHGDILKMTLPSFDICIANLPYQLSSSLIMKLLTHKPHYRTAILMLQTEFALSLIARPGDLRYCRLSVNIQLLSSVKFLENIGSHNSSSRSNVKSTLIELKPKKNKSLVDFREWDGLVRLCFERKNKTICAIFRQHLTGLNLEKSSMIYRAPERIEIRQFKALKKKTLKDSKLSKNKRSKLQKIIQSIVVDNGFEEMRPSNMRQEDFLRFMVIMNSKGIYFS